MAVFFGTLCMYSLSDLWALLVLAGTPKNQSHSPGGANALTKLMHCASSRRESPLCMSSRSVQPFLHCPPIRPDPEKGQLFEEHRPICPRMNHSVVINHRKAINLYPFYLNNVGL